VDVELYSMGEILVDLIPRGAGPPQESTPYEVHFGGAPANTAVAAAKLGHTAGFIGAVGNDPLGEFLVSTLHGWRVDTSMVAVKQARTTLAFVLAGPGGGRSYFFYREPWARTADTLLEPGDVDAGRVAESTALHYSGFSMSHPPLSQAVEYVVEEAARGGTVVSYDPTYRPDIWPSFQAALEAHAWSLAHASVVSLNLEEAEVFHGETRPAELASTLLDKHPQLLAVAVRMGARGAYAMERGGRHAYRPAPPVEVVDTTGAGDTWNAAFLVAYVLEAAPLEEALEFANAAASLKCMRRGAAASPTREEVEEFISRARGAGGG